MFTRLGTEILCLSMNFGLVHIFAQKNSIFKMQPSLFKRFLSEYYPKKKLIKQSDGYLISL